jgi:hypothetical protein
VQGEYNGTGAGPAIFGYQLAGSGPAIIGVKNNTTDNSAAIYGQNLGNPAQNNFGVWGTSVNGSGGSFGGYFNSSAADGNGLLAEANSGTVPYAVWARTTAPGGQNGSRAGFFEGDVEILGNLDKLSGNFKIDHPLDPANKYLIHSFVESPDMMNVYNGNITTDANGEAVVSLPSYFEAENIDFKYQLTCMGQFAQAIVLKKVENNQFTIKTDKPNVEVSWQVTGVRNDLYAQKHRIVAEVEKTGAAAGKYLVPELYGYGPEMAVDKRSQQAKIKIKQPAISAPLSPGK